MESEFTGRKKVFVLALITVLSIMALGLLAVICYFLVDAVVTEKTPPRTLASTAPLESYSKAAVASNGYLCAKIGKDILKENGTAVDAAIATLICEGVMCLQSTGIGGGFLMTIYDKKSNTVEVLNARETAPLAASENMYHENETLSEKGGLAVAVPGELKGYHAAYKKYGGGVPWKRLFEPSIKICNEGFIIPKYLGNHILFHQKSIMGSPTLRELFLNPKTGKLLGEGDLLKRQKLGKFLEVIANEGISPFYEGRIAKDIVAEVKEEGGILTEKDLKDYKVQWMKPTFIKWGDYKMYSSPAPGSGEILAFMMNLIQNFVPVPDDATTSQRIVESFKWGYGRRTELGDISEDSFVPSITHTRELIKNLTSKEYALNVRKKIKDKETSQDPTFYGAQFVKPEDHGTCHISVMGPNGDAVSVTATINTVFAAKFASKSTGILYNNEMADFSAPNITNPFGLPPSPTNFIRPGKRPFSSMCPTIFLNEKNDVELVIGASGGPRITTTVTYVAFLNLILNKNIKEAIDLPRIHHQLFPMETDFEKGYPSKIITNLQEIGHKTTITEVTRTSTVTAVRKQNGKITASFDYRRGGSVDGF